MFLPIASHPCRGAGRLLAAAGLLALTLGWRPAAAEEAQVDAFPATVATPRAIEATPAAGLFGTRETRSGNLAAFRKWRGVMTRYARERHLEDRPCSGGGIGACALQHWRAFLDGIAERDSRYQLNAVQRYVNRVRYRDDRARFGKSDYWATPREFLGRGGDCEDYAIAKYLSLRALGFDPNAMRIVVLQDMSRNLAHAVLVLRHQGERLVLDNQLKMVVAARKIRHYRPYYSINENYWWRHKKPSGRPGSKPAVIAQRDAG